MCSFQDPYWVTCACVCVCFYTIVNATKRILRGNAIDIMIVLIENIKSEYWVRFNMRMKPNRFSFWFHKPRIGSKVKTAGSTWEQSKPVQSVRFSSWIGFKASFWKKKIPFATNICVCSEIVQILFFIIKKLFLYNIKKVSRFLVPNLEPEVIGSVPDLCSREIHLKSIASNEY